LATRCGCGAWSCRELEPVSPDARPAVTDVVDEAGRLTQTFDGIIEVRPHASREITLARPDGYVAFSASDRDGAAAIRDIDALLRRQVQMMQPSHDRGAFAS
jgi:hypothetical protein